MPFRVVHGYDYYGDIGCSIPLLEELSHLNNLPGKLPADKMFSGVNLDGAHYLLPFSEDIPEHEPRVAYRMVLYDGRNKRALVTDVKSKDLLMRIKSAVDREFQVKERAA